MINAKGKSDKSFPVALIIGIIFLLGISIQAAEIFIRRAATPEICRGLPDDFDTASNIFNQRLTEKFPTPLSAENFVKIITSMGFKVTGSIAVSEFSSLPCSYRCSISWKIKNDKSTDIKGSYGATCL